MDSNLRLGIEYEIFTRLLERYPSFGGYILSDSLIEFASGRYGFAETLEDLSCQAGIDSKKFLEFVNTELERIKNEYLLLSA